MPLLSKEQPCSLPTYLSFKDTKIDVQHIPDSRLYDLANSSFNRIQPIGINHVFKTGLSLEITIPLVDDIRSAATAMAALYNEIG